MEPDPYERSDYRRLIAWDARIRREGPFLRGLLERAPDRSVLDVGCGSGEHTAFFAQEGARAVGLDLSESMLESARVHEAQGHGRFVPGDARRMSAAVKGEEPFGMAICLGNMLPHLLEDVDVRAFFGEAARVLRPGGLLLIQLLNYERILRQDIRHLPLNFREHDEGEIVFLRLLRSSSETRLLFFPTTLVLRPDAEEPVTVERSRRVELRPWTSRELVPALEAAGFQVERYGDLHGTPFEADSSADLVLVGVLGS